MYLYLRISLTAPLVQRYGAPQRALCLPAALRMPSTLSHTISCPTSSRREANGWEVATCRVTPAIEFRHSCRSSEKSSARCSCRTSLLFVLLPVCSPSTALPTSQSSVHRQLETRPFFLPGRQLESPEALGATFSCLCRRLVANPQPLALPLRARVPQCLWFSALTRGGCSIFLALSTTGSVTRQPRVERLPAVAER